MSFEKTKMIVFWSKDPFRMLKRLDEIERRCKNYSFQFTLNDYEKEKIEPNVPNIEMRIATFKELSARIGKDRIIWRFDPLLISNDISVDELCRRIEKIGNEIANYTSKLVFSFIDISNCKKAKAKLSKFDSNIRELTIDEKIEISERIGKLSSGWGINAATCGEDIGLEKYGIKSNRCIDDEMIVKCFNDCKELMDFIGATRNENGVWKISKHKKDPGQRKACGCIMSKDIGCYETCVHNCAYCYANLDHDVAMQNYQKHQMNKYSDSII